MTGIYPWLQWSEPYFYSCHCDCHLHKQPASHSDRSSFPLKQKTTLIFPQNNVCLYQCVPVLVHNWQLYPIHVETEPGYIAKRDSYFKTSPNSKYLKYFSTKRNVLKDLKRISALWSALDPLYSVKCIPFLLWRYSEHEEAMTAVTQQISRMKRTENTIDSAYWTNSRENVIVEKSLIFSLSNNKQYL